MGKKSARIAELEASVQQAVEMRNEAERTRSAVQRRAEEAERTMLDLGDRLRLATEEMERIGAKLLKVEEEISTRGIALLKVERDRARTLLATLLPSLNALAEIGRNAADRIVEIEAVLANEPVKVKRASKRVAATNGAAK